MRIVLLYPPPWKIAAVGHCYSTAEGGPPEGHREGDIDADFYQVPYGLLSLAAQAFRRGHQVKVLNLSAFSWNKVESTLASLEADLFGLSCYTANRRGVALVAQVLRREHPKSCVVVGGPHATALPREMLAHHREIDAVVLGEGEETLLEIVSRLEQGEPLHGIAGLAWRQGERCEVGPPRARLVNLDSLAPVSERFQTHLLMTSRGCPGHCSYCAKNAVWGKLWRAHSPAWVLSAVEQAAARLPVKMLLIKDDTFTADRRRALEICRALRERKISLLWSCDTRADALDPELLREMRLAGCQRISLGVESGSPSILKNIGKSLSPDRVLRATRLAQEVGLQVRWFMMLGNRGETSATFQESLAFLRRGNPDQFLFACLSVYPGTRDFDSLVRQGDLDSHVYFEGDFLELKMPFDANPSDTAVLSEWFDNNKGLRELRKPSLAECEAVLQRLGDHHAAHLDLALACYESGALGRAQQHAQRSIALGLPTPGLAWNLLAAIAARQKDYAEVLNHLERANREDPLHPVLLRNRQLHSSWVEKEGARKDNPLALIASADFQVFERLQQPTLPGPLPEDFATWE